MRKELLASHMNSTSMFVDMAEFRTVVLDSESTEWFHGWLEPNISVK
jgi:hypothetical protein